MQQLVVFERVADDGGTERTELAAEDGALSLVVAGRAASLPPGAIEAVMRRYGRPLDAAVPLAGPALELGEGRRLVQLRFRPRFDVIARDYLVLDAPPGPPLAELSTGVVAALAHLARASE